MVQNFVNKPLFPASPPAECAGGAGGGPMPRAGRQVRGATGRRRGRRWRRLPGGRPQRRLAGKPRQQRRAPLRAKAARTKRDDLNCHEKRIPTKTPTARPGAVCPRLRAAPLRRGPGKQSPAPAGIRAPVAPQGCGHCLKARSAAGEAGPRGEGGAEWTAQLSTGQDVPRRRRAGLAKPRGGQLGRG